MADAHRLYAITHSLYSGRARAYLIKQGIPFRELSSGHESFKAEVLPKGKVPTIPTLVTPEGEVIRDGAAIIEHFEFANDRPCRPGMEDSVPEKIGNRALQQFTVGLRSKIVLNTLLDRRAFHLLAPDGVGHNFGDGRGFQNDLGLIDGGLGE